MNPKNSEAMLIKADAKYHLGHFEIALICYHKGKLLARGKMLESFRHGVRRTEEAISEYFETRAEVLFNYPNPAFFEKNILFESYSNLKKYTLSKCEQDSSDIPDN